MATRITRIDDIDGSDSAEAISFELDHLAYEIDLGPRNRAKFLRMIRPFIERARVVGGEEPANSASRPSARSYVDSNDGVPLFVTTDDEASSDGPDLIEMARQLQG